jgi:hypothetical protein
MMKEAKDPDKKDFMPLRSISIFAKHLLLQGSDSRNTWRKYRDRKDFMPLSSISIFAKPLAAARIRQQEYMAQIQGAGSGHPLSAWPPYFNQGAPSLNQGGLLNSGGGLLDSGGGFSQASSLRHGMSPVDMDIKEPKKRRSSPGPGISKPSTNKRIKGTPSKNPVQLKDAVTRSQFEMFTDRLHVCQKMTSYGKEKKAGTCPQFCPVAITMDEVVKKPHEHDMSDMRRKLPLWTIFMSENQDVKEMGKSIEAFGKALQNVQQHNKKKNRSFDVAVVNDPDQYYRAHYGAKVRKKGGKPDVNGAGSM